MPVVYCKQCGKKNRAPDAAIGKKGKCSVCGEVMLIPAQDDPEPIIQMTSAEPPALPAAASAPPPLPQSSPEHCDTWFVQSDGKIEGPFTRQTLEARISAGYVTPDTMIGMDGVSFKCAGNSFPASAFATASPPRRKSDQPQPKPASPATAPVTNSKNPKSKLLLAGAGVAALVLIVAAISLTSKRTPPLSSGMAQYVNDVKKAIQSGDADAVLFSTMTAENTGQFDADVARRELDGIIASDPGNGYAYFAVARALMKRADKDPNADRECLKAVHKAIECQPREAGFYYWLGLHLELGGGNPDLPGAVEAMRMAVKLKPGDAEYQAALADLLAETGNDKGAVTDFRPSQSPGGQPSAVAPKTAVTKSMDRLISFELVETPLSDAITFLQALAPNKIALAPQLADKGNTPIDLVVKNVPLRKALDQVAAKAGLQVVVDKGVYWITGAAPEKPRVQNESPQLADLYERMSLEELTQRMYQRFENIEKSYRGLDITWTYPPVDQQEMKFRAFVERHAAFWRRSKWDLRAVAQSGAGIVVDPKDAPPEVKLSDAEKEAMSKLRKEAGEEVYDWEMYTLNGDQRRSLRTIARFGGSDGLNYFKSKHPEIEAEKQAQAKAKADVETKSRADAQAQQEAEARARAAARAKSMPPKGGGLSGVDNPQANREPEYLPLVSTEILRDHPEMLNEYRAAATGKGPKRLNPLQVLPDSKTQDANGGEPQGNKPAPTTGQNKAKSMLNMANQYVKARNLEKAAEYAKKVISESPGSPEADEAKLILQLAEDKK